MTRDVYKNPSLQSGYQGDEKAGEHDTSGPAPRTEGVPAATSRGMRAPKEGSGAVVGSGAGAGGGGNPEDYDGDAQGGGGSATFEPARSVPDDGADAPVGGSR